MKTYIIVLAILAILVMNNRISTITYGPGASGQGTTYSDGSTYHVIEPVRDPCDVPGSYTRNNPFARFVKGFCLSRGTGTP